MWLVGEKKMEGAMIFLTARGAIFWSEKNDRQLIKKPIKFYGQHPSALAPKSWLQLTSWM